jgi:hypothetical protein
MKAVPTYAAQETSSTPIGGRTFMNDSVRISEDCFVAAWVWKGAPFRAREANAMSNDWRVDNKDGQLQSLGLSREAAEEQAEKLNMLAATVMLLKGG